MRHLTQDSEKREGSYIRGKRRSDIFRFPDRANRTELEELIANRNTPRKLVWRAGSTLAKPDGHGTVEMTRQADMTMPTGWYWQERSLDAGIPGLKRDTTIPARVPKLRMGTRRKVIAQTAQSARPKPSPEAAR